MGLVTSLPVSDVTLIHASRISDEEENRFQMGVAVYGLATHWLRVGEADALWSLVRQRLGGESAEPNP